MKACALTDLRTKIDQLDDRILELLQQRAEVAVEIGRVKKQQALAITDRDREKKVLARLTDLSQGRTLGGEAVREIFSAVIRACRAAQAPIRVAFLGPAGTFSQAAALNQFGALGIYLPQDDLPAVFEAVESGRADFGLMPFENSIEGVVGQTLDLLGRTSLQARGMVTLPIALALMSRGAGLSAVRRVASHPQPLAQARGWLSLNLPGVELIAAASSAAAASRLDEKGEAAVIGHPALADYQGLNIVAEHIEDQPHNQTFFLVMGRGQENGPDQARPGGAGRGAEQRTMCWFTAPHNSGSLYVCLQPLADAGVNLTRLHSRACPEQPGAYRFFLEMEGRQGDEKVDRALAELQKHAETFRLLGSYEVGTTAEAGNIS